MPHLGRTDLVAYRLKLKTRKEYKFSALQFLKYCKEMNIKVFEMVDFDSVPGKYIHHELVQSVIDGWDHVNKVMSALQF